MMRLAEIEKRGVHVKARMTRLWNHSVEEVWSWLTENEKLQQWFSELEIEDLRVGGRIHFDMGDGTFQEMTILAVEEPSLLEYTWGEDSVRFELTPRDGGCHLVFTEVINEVTDHTPKDLAGWHLCLGVVEALLEGQPIDFWEKEWEARYAEYQALMEEE